MPVILADGIGKGVFFKARQGVRPFFLFCAAENPALKIFGLNHEHAERRNDNIVNLRRAVGRGDNQIGKMAVLRGIQLAQHGNFDNLLAHIALFLCHAFAAGVDTARFGWRLGGIRFDWARLFPARCSRRQLVLVLICQDVEHGKHQGNKDQGVCEFFHLEAVLIGCAVCAGCLKLHLPKPKSSLHPSIHCGSFTASSAGQPLCVLVRT